MFRKALSLIIVAALLPLSNLKAEQALVLPRVGTMVALSAPFTPASLKGLVIYPNDPFKFDFIISHGDEVLPNAQKQESYTNLIKYFLAALAVADDQQWVNLSPYEKDRIIPETFGQTQMGNDLLAQDYILKQLSASLLYPEGEIGKKFWAQVYAQAADKNVNVPINTFNKVWIVPDRAVVYEKGNAVYVVENHLKVMTEQDYLASQKNDTATQDPTINAFKDIVLPQIEKEINEGRNFALLRQVYSGMLLATWYKRTLQDSILAKLYVNKGKIQGVDSDPRKNDVIYDQYLQAFKKGVFNMIKEDASSITATPRKYFSGGAESYAKTNISKTTIDLAMLNKQLAISDIAKVELNGEGNPTRRNFLKQFSTIVAGSALIPGVVTVSQKHTYTAIRERTLIGAVQSEIMPVRSISGRVFQYPYLDGDYIEFRIVALSKRTSTGGKYIIESIGGAQEVMEISDEYLEQHERDLPMKMREQESKRKNLIRKHDHYEYYDLHWGFEVLNVNKMDNGLLLKVRWDEWDWSTNHQNEGFIKVIDEDIFLSKLSRTRRSLDAAMLGFLFGDSKKQYPTLLEGVHQRDLSEMRLDEIIDEPSLKYLQEQGLTQDAIELILHDPSRTVGRSLGLYEPLFDQHLDAQFRQVSLIDRILDQMLVKKATSDKTVSVLQIGLGQEGFKETEEIIELFNDALNRAKISKKDRAAWQLVIKAADYDSNTVKHFLKFSKSKSFRIAFEAAQVDALIESDVERVTSYGDIDIVFSRNVHYGNYEAAYGNINLEKVIHNPVALRNILGVYVFVRNIMKHLKAGTYYIIEPVEGSVNLRIPGAISMGDGVYVVKESWPLNTHFQDFLGIQQVVNLPQPPEGKVFYPGDPDIPELFSKGGIDMNGSSLDLQIKRDGQGMVLPVGRQDLDKLHINGLVPVILDIKPADPAVIFA